MKIVFSTRNQSKIREVNQILGAAVQLIGLQDIDSHEEIPETPRWSKSSPYIVGYVLLAEF